MKEKESLVGRRFGRLVVKEKVENDKEGNTQYLCLCDCKNSIVVKETSLLDKSIRNCGCFSKKNIVSKDIYKPYRDERVFKVWQYMLARCYNPAHHAYAYYGQKGVKVCDEWRNDYTKFRDFLFANGYDEEAPFGECTIDRIDNLKGYSPNNCRVVSMREQSLNKTNNHRIDYKGKNMTVTEAAEMNGLSNHQVFNRLDKGWSMDKALHQPLGKVSTYTASNQTRTTAEWAEIMGVTNAVIRGRLKTHTMQEIYDEWEANDKTIIVNDFTVKHEVAEGKTMNRTEWAQEIGISVATLRKLLKEHTMQEIYDDWKANNGRLSFIRCNTLEEANGEAHNRKEWCEILHISPKCLRNKLNKMSMQEIYDMYKS